MTAFFSFFNDCISSTNVTSLTFHFVWYSVVILLSEMLSLILKCKAGNMSWDKCSLTDIIIYDIACDKTVIHADSNYKRSTGSF